MAGMYGLNRYRKFKSVSRLDMLNSMFGANNNNKSRYNVGKQTAPFVSVSSANRDTLTISSAGKAKSAINHRNTTADSSVDLQSYIDKARRSNEEALANAGSAIDRNAIKFTSMSDAMREALNDKYAKVSKAASESSDKEQYLQDKYFNKASSIYESDLTDSERSIGYQNERSFLTNGRVRGLNTGDSLFRGIVFDGDRLDNDRLIFERKTINTQVMNILSDAGTDTASIPDTCTFSVDPYSYEITVGGVDDDLKSIMEEALNVGDNGKNLFRHIYHAADQGGSTQVTDENKMKYRAAQLVREYTGLDISKMTAKEGTLLTDDGEDILTVTDTAIDNKVPYDYRKQIKDWVRSLVADITKKGWDNIPDMTLSIAVGKNGLHDIGLKNSSVLGAGNEWYAVM